MGLNFRKSISLGKGLKLNLSKSGPSVSFGKSGFRQSVNLKGQARTTVGIPGTGIYYTKNTNVKNVVGALTGKKPISNTLQNTMYFNPFIALLANK